MADKFKAGDIVMLKSGGPDMTVEKVNDQYGNEPSTYTCSWFAGAKDNKKMFTEAALKAVEE